MKLILENWREYLKEGVIDAELHFLQKIAKDNGEILEFKEEDGKHIVTLFELPPLPGGKNSPRGEELEKHWIDPDIRTLFQPVFQGEFDTKESAIEYAKDVIKVLQDSASKEEESHQHHDENSNKIVSLYENWREFKC